MEAKRSKRLSLTQPAMYRILVQGILSEGWEDWFEGMRMTQLEPADVFCGTTDEQFPAQVTLLTGVVPDQAALLGMLHRFYAFGLPILLVEFVSGDED